MNAEDRPAASDATEQTEPTSEATEQTTESESPSSLQDELIALAKTEGHQIGIELPEPAAEPESEPEESEAESTELKAEEGTDTEEEEEKPAEKGEEWAASAKQRVAEETAKRKRANERADKETARAEKAEAYVRELEGKLASVSGPRPTPEDPFRDVTDVMRLDNMERSYEDAIDLLDQAIDVARENGTAEVPVGKDAAGNPIVKELTEAQIREKRRLADKAIRRQIPERRKYLDERAKWDAIASEAFAEEQKNPEFAQATEFLTQRLLSGEAQRSPDIRVWVNHAVRDYMRTVAKNGQTQSPTTEADKIIKSAKQKVAPTPTRSRSLVERKGPSLEQAEKQLAEKGDEESAEKVLEAIFSKRQSGAKRLERIAE